MSDRPAQNLANHARFVPLYHFALFGILVVNLGWSVWQAWRGFGFASAFAVLMALGLIGIAFYARSFALTVQDRVIRLEERLRLERLVPADQRPAIDRLTRGQFVALRFASDAELPALFTEVAAGRLTEPAAIKQAVKNWRADYLRA